MTFTEKENYLNRHYIGYTYCDNRMYAEIYTLIGVPPIVVDITDYNYSDIYDLCH